jgi:hypothetical protein
MRDGQTEVRVLQLHLYACIARGRILIFSSSRLRAQIVSILCQVESYRNCSKDL